MESALVVGVDGSDASLTAVDWAADEAARHGWPLRIVHASLWERYEGAVPAFTTDRPADQILAENIVGVAGERAERRQPGLTVTTEVLAEDASRGLLREEAKPQPLSSDPGAEVESPTYCWDRSVSPWPRVHTVRLSSSGETGRHWRRDISASCWASGARTWMHPPCGSPSVRRQSGTRNWRCSTPGVGRRMNRSSTPSSPVR